MIRKALFERLKNVVWAAVFAIALWLVMVQSEQDIRTVDATFRVLPPPGVNVKYVTENNKAPTFSVTIRGTKPSLDRLDPTYDATYEIPAGSSEGQKTYPTRNFEIRGLPQDVTEDKSSLTQEVQVVLAQRKNDFLRVRLECDRKLPDRWEIQSEVVDPPTLQASGSVEDMDRDPELKTDVVPLLKAATKQGFNPDLLQPQTIEWQVGVEAPGGITVNDQRRVVARFRLVPKAKERDDFEVVPKLVFPGPGFPGLPFKLIPFISPNKIRLRVSGPEASLTDAAVEKTKEGFLVYIEITPEMLAKLKLGERLDFEVKVVPPPNITVHEVLNPADKRFRLSVEEMDKPLSPEDKPR